jgi:ubiquitin-conjugating enzyme E2 N
MSGLPKRIIKESERLVKEPVQGISATPHDDNLRYFDVTIDGPSQSPYEGESVEGDRRSDGSDIII